jgi:hypothetical protein
MWRRRSAVVLAGISPIRGRLIGYSHCIRTPNQEDVINRMFMEIVSERDRRISIENLDTHHYENETFQQHAGAARNRT